MESGNSDNLSDAIPRDLRTTIDSLLMRGWTKPRISRTVRKIVKESGRATSRCELALLAVDAYLDEVQLPLADVRQMAQNRLHELGVM
jgi:hypothetical protein